MTPFTNQNGKIYMSEDGIGINSAAGGPVSVHKSSSSTTVVQAWVLAAGIPNYVLVNGDVRLNGTPLTWSSSLNASGNFGVNSRGADVTSIVKPIVDAAPVGDVAFTVAEPNNTFSIDGEILAVILNDPTLPTNNTVSFLFGALSTTGDNFSIGLAQPLNLSDPNLALTMSLGDSYSYQFGQPGHACGGGQFSLIDVNASRLASCAGNFDDGIADNGGLLTVGGVGDSTDNPADPNSSTSGTDDELYNLKPFVHNGDTSIKVHNSNPSNNDNIFFTGFQLNSATAVVGKGILLSPTSGSEPVGGSHTVTATVRDSTGAAIPNTVVSFSVTAGPNAGKTGTATTNGAGQATFTYTDTGGAGTDRIVATFRDNANVLFTSNTATNTWGAASADHGIIFQVELRRCHTVHVGYNHFPNGTVVKWNVSQNKAVVSTGQFTAIGPPNGRPKTYHFLTQPLGVTLQATPKGHVHFRWLIGGVKYGYTATRAVAGC